MLIVISPAKTLDFETPVRIRKHTMPDFLKQSRQLMKRLRELSVDDLRSLMGISEELAKLNHQRNRDWKTPFTTDNARQAVLAFRGDVYEGLQAQKWKSADFQVAQKRLRILSGLYGLLRPLDLMQAYRLEMGTKLSTDAGTNLYQFWGDRITTAVSEQLGELKSDVLINLASNEYFKAVRPKSLEARVITPAFRERKNGEYRMISFFSKQARGLMSDYIIRNRLTEPDDIKAFDVDGYAFEPGLSDGDGWVFARNGD